MKWVTLRKQSCSGSCHKFALQPFFRAKCLLDFPVHGMELHSQVLELQSNVRQPEWEERICCRSEFPGDFSAQIVQTESLFSMKSYWNGSHCIWEIASSVSSISAPGRYWLCRIFTIPSQCAETTAVEIFTNFAADKWILKCLWKWA